MFEAFRAAALAGDVTSEQAKEILSQTHKTVAAGPITFWLSRVDPKTGKTFYYSPQTKKSLWVLPPGGQIISASTRQSIPRLEGRSQSLSTQLGTTQEYELACGACDADVTGLVHCKKCGALVIVPDKDESTSKSRPNLRLSLEDGKPENSIGVEEDPKSPKLTPISPPSKAAPTRSGYTPKSRASPLHTRMNSVTSKVLPPPVQSEPPSPKLPPMELPASIMRAPSKPAPRRAQSVVPELESPLHEDKKAEYDMQRKPSELERKLREAVDPATRLRERSKAQEHAPSIPDELPPPPDEPPPEESPPVSSEDDPSARDTSVSRPSRRMLVRGLDDVEDMVVGHENAEPSKDDKHHKDEKDEKELQAFIESLRPQYGDGQLAKEPEKYLKNFFVQMINIPESKRHIVFHEFFLSVFWHEPVLQELLKYSSWKQWLLILISEAQNTSDEILDYVLMTLIGMCGYFFRKYSESANAVCYLESREPLPLGSGTEMRSMRDFLIDATTEIDRHSQGISLRVLAGTAVKIVAWDRRPAWVAPDFAAGEWQNLFSMLEAQEEYLFFPLPDRQFTLPDVPYFAGMPVIESTIAMLEKIKVHQLDAVPETPPELARLQKLYSTKGMQELEFFKGLRDFFAFYGQIDCMEIYKSEFAIKAKVPPNCSLSEFCHLLQSRKRIEYQKVQKTVTEYLKNVREHYRKVFSGEIAFNPRLDRSKKTRDTKEDGSVRRTLVRENSIAGRPHGRQSSIRVGETRLL